MINQKRSATTDITDEAATKKIKSAKDGKTKNADIESSKSPKGFNKSQKAVAHVPTNTSNQEKPNWNEFKKEKKELKVKRKQTKGFFDEVSEAKAIAEKLRRKQLKGGTAERSELVAQLHKLLGGKDMYSKLVLTHDMARVVQYVLKYGTENIRGGVLKEIVPGSLEMLMSKYGRYCFKSMMKYGNAATRAAALEKLYGNAVKLCSHVVSATIFEYSYSTYATQLHKQNFIQEFFGDMYKQSKDINVKHLSDVYKYDDSLKAAALNATKSNLTRVFNKNLFDSGLVQTVLCQYISECSPSEKTDLISQLAQHAVILSNSRDGVRVVMQCIWHGTSKEKKMIVKSVRENLIDLAKHEHAHCVIITLLDSVDDTVLLNKILVSQIVTNAAELVKNEWGRKILLWLVAPGDPVHFHPTLVKELDAGKKESTSRKEVGARREEILTHCSADLLKCIITDSLFWLSTASIAFVTIAILKCSVDSTEALQSISKTITVPDWQVKENDKTVLGIEHPGLHMALKKLAQHDKISTKNKFGAILLDTIDKSSLKTWLTLNRGCFLLINIYENGGESIQQQMKEKLEPHMKLIKKQETAGAKLLHQKIL